MSAGAHFRPIVRVVREDFATLNKLRRRLGKARVRPGFLLFLACGHTTWVTVVRNPSRALCRKCARRR